MDEYFKEISLYKVNNFLMLNKDVSSVEYYFLEAEESENYISYVGLLFVDGDLKIPCGSEVSEIYSKNKRSVIFNENIINEHFYKITIPEKYSIPDKYKYIFE